MLVATDDANATDVPNTELGYDMSDSVVPRNAVTSQCYHDDDREHVTVVLVDVER